MIKLNIEIHGDDVAAVQRDALAIAAALGDARANPVTVTVSTTPTKAEKPVKAEKPSAPVAEDQPAEKPAAPKAEKPAAPKAEAPAPGSVTLAQLRDKGMKLISAQRADELKKAVAELGAQSLSTLDPSKFEEAAKRLDALLAV